MLGTLQSDIAQNITPSTTEVIRPNTLSWNFFYEQSVQLLHTTAQILPTLLLGVVLLVLSYLISGPLSRLLIKPIDYMTDSKLVHLVIRRSISTLIILFGVYLFLRLAGLTQFAVAIMSGTGLIGLILGFAFRDIAENFIASLLLSVQRPFKIDDVIEVDGRLGIVKKVTARATTLVDYDGNHIQIPNATVYKNTIKNLTANPKMRGKVEIGIGYDNDIRSAQTLALKIVNQQAAVLNDPPAQVLIKNLGSSTINFILYFWVNGELHSSLKVSSQLMRELVNEFTNQNISMPDDARERIILNTAQSELASSELKQPHTDNKNSETQAQTQTLNDVSSDTDEIREQAEQSRDPEQGKNII
ncbi:mechanosensitive channel protein [Pseudoalteromonas sp. BSi20652]|uniref:mechanosensitive ion channel family protein n=1 Tax=Pseudoalteromonas sp. BSi20652 TaxID=388384 RepID=UPI0002316A85|nr:mechanosensitive ion channel domain-containing protein [Pseudoalteromonas sp. BSi20652]GAA59137.1 mechanosensitive channel protein [Pseudoalteromonas sp. BSi20652]